MATILVLEDDSTIRDVVAGVLEDEGYAVVAAPDGESLWDAATGWPALVLLDLRLVRVDGDEVLARLRANPAARHIPVVVMSAIADLEAYAARPGVAAILPKPFDLEELLGLVAAWAGPPG